MNPNALGVPHASTLNIKFIYYIATILPFISVTACWIVYYSFKHWDINYLPTISLSVSNFPESRIFAVTMGIECILLIIVLTCRLFSIILAIHQNIGNLQLIHKLLLFVTFSFGFWPIICLFVFSCVSIRENYSIHNAAFRIFFIFNSIHYIIYDLKPQYFCIKNSLLSKLCTWAIIIFIIGFVFMNSVRQGPSQSISSICQYFAFAFSFIKIALIARDSPKQLLNLSPTTIHNARNHQ